MHLEASPRHRESIGDASRKHRRCGNFWSHCQFYIWNALGVHRESFAKTSARHRESIADAFRISFHKNTSRVHQENFNACIEFLLTSWRYYLIPFNTYPRLISSLIASRTHRQDIGNAFAIFVQKTGQRPICIIPLNLFVNCFANTS